MTDPLLTERSVATHDDKILPTAIYILYLVGLFNGLTILIGLVMAYVLREGASDRALSHYDFQIRTVWVGIAWAVIGCLLCIVGVPLSFVLVGLPLLFVGWGILALLGLWFIVRCVIGLALIARDQPYPRPRAWLF